LKGSDTLFFSAADNTLPGHVRAESWVIPILKQVGVSIWLFFNAKRIISQYKLEKLNIHSGAGGVLLIRKPSIPVVLTCHHTYWQHYRYIKSQFWKRIFYPFEKRTYQLADTIICDCEDTRRVLSECYGVPDSKMTIIPCAVDTDAFFPTGQPREPMTALYIGRIDKRKGVDFLIESMALVRDELPEARLLVGGSGKDSAQLKERVGQLHLEKNVTFLGFVPDDQLNALYNRAQCVVVPSVFEGFGITVIEAAATRTRVVGTDVDGIRSTLQSGDYGALVPYGDCRAMADAIAAELRAPRKPQELGPEYRVDYFRKRYLEELGG
jgi:glycosyltransferase involved in cell wall biosynthesis